MLKIGVLNCTENIDVFCREYGDLDKMTMPFMFYHNASNHFGPTYNLLLQS